MIVEPTHQGPEDRQAVADILRRMPLQQARILTLVYEWGFTHTEVAVMLGATPAAVKTAVWRAREAFRALYETENDIDE